MKINSFHFPWITVIITVAAVILYLVGSPLCLAWKPGLQVWRLFTCHLIHWSGDHLLWDAGMFLLLGTWCETTNKKAYAAFLITSAIAIPITVNIFNPSLDYYAGLSGLDMGQAALGVSLLLKKKIYQKKNKQALFLALLTLGIVVKLIYEFTQKNNFFVGNGQDFIPVPIAHAVGVLVGLLLGLDWDRIKKPTQGRR